MQLSNSTKGILLALLGASAWGAMGVAGQNVLQHFSFTPWDLVSLRLLCAGSILLILLFLQRGKAALAPMQNKRDAFDITLCGIMIGVSQLTFFLILRAYVWVVRPPILVNESLLTNTERAPGNRVAKYRARPQAARRYAA